MKKVLLLQLAGTMALSMSDMGPVISVSTRNNKNPLSDNFCCNFSSFEKERAPVAQWKRNQQQNSKRKFK